LNYRRLATQYSWPVTGFSNFEFSMDGKWLQIAKEMPPDVKRANVLFNPDTVPGRRQDFPLLDLTQLGDLSQSQPTCFDDHSKASRFLRLKNCAAMGRYLPTRGNLCPTIQQLKAWPGLVSAALRGSEVEADRYFRNAPIGGVEQHHLRRCDDVARLRSAEG
jgi:hypothetical protein